MQHANDNCANAYRINHENEFGAGNLYWAEELTATGWKHVLFTYGRSRMDSWDLLIRGKRHA